MKRRTTTQEREKQLMIVPTLNYVLYKETAARLYQVRDEFQDLRLEQRN